MCISFAPHGVLRLETRNHLRSVGWCATPIRRSSVLQSRPGVEHDNRVVGADEAAVAQLRQRRPGRAALGTNVDSRSCRKLGGATLYGDFLDRDRGASCRAQRAQTEKAAERRWNT